MWHSLRKLAALADETRVFCGHEYTVSNIRFARLADPANMALADRQQEAAALRRRNQPTLPSTIGLERRTNPFMRCEEPAIEERASAMASAPQIAAEFAKSRLGGLDEAPVRTLALLRAWKNTV
jgi:hydroxyacylglutathione hydrolase